VHEYEGQEWYMPCEYHNKEDLQKYKCPKGYKKNYKTGIKVAGATAVVGGAYAAGKSKRKS
jgi:hypothetical protein